MAEERVAYQGEAGAYSEEGAQALWPQAELVPLQTIRKVFEAVEVGLVDRGLVPMDNSQAGSINETYDLFLKHGLHLVGETIVRVDHCLLALPGTTIDDLTEVISHPQAVSQSEEVRRRKAGDHCRDRVSSRCRVVWARCLGRTDPNVPRQLHALRGRVARS